MHNKIYNAKPYIDTVKAGSAPACQQQCQKTAQCEVWSCADDCFYCILHHVAGDLQDAEGWTSGPKVCPPADA